MKRDEGMAPVKRFVLRSRCWRETKLPSSGGMGPEKELPLRSKCCNVAMVNSSREMVPVRERLGREREMTELPVVVGLHWTPIQLQGVESVGTQDVSEDVD